MQKSINLHFDHITRPEAPLATSDLKLVAQTAFQRPRYVKTNFQTETVKTNRTNSNTRLISELQRAVTFLIFIFYMSGMRAFTSGIPIGMRSREE